MRPNSKSRNYISISSFKFKEIILDDTTVFYSIIIRRAQFDKKDLTVNDRYHALITWY